MGDRKIDLKLTSSADMRGIREANTQIVQMGYTLGKANKQLSNEARRAWADFASLGDAAGKTSALSVRSAKEIDEAWKKVVSSATEAEGSVSGVGKALKVLTSILGGFGGPIGFIAKNLLLGSIWQAAGKAISYFSDRLEKAREAADKMKEAKLSDEMKAIKKSAEDMSSAFDKGTSAIERQLSQSKSLLDVQEKLVKANLELKKQNELSSAIGNKGAQEVIEKKYSSLQVHNDMLKEEKRLLAEKSAASGNLEAGKKWLSEMDVWFGDVDKRISDYRSKVAKIEEHAKTAARHGAVNSMKEYLEESGEAKDYARYNDQIKNLSEERAKGDDAVAKMREKMSGYSDTIKLADEELKAIEKVREAHEAETERYVKERELALDKEEKKAEQDAKKAAEERLKADANAADARVKAAKAAAKEYEKAEMEIIKKLEDLDRQRHELRMADLKDEIEKQKEASTPLQAVAAAAQTEFERAFSMYRDPAKAQKQIAEERDYAADLKQLHKDANRYGGKWRIDELSQLMSAGDTQGVTDTLERWRKNKNFTPQVEAMVRASAAEQTKTTAEDELRKLNDKTERLVADLKDLSDTRDAKLDGIERNTNQLANKLDELLSVKG